MSYEQMGAGGGTIVKAHVNIAADPDLVARGYGLRLVQRGAAGSISCVLDLGVEIAESEFLGHVQLDGTAANFAVIDWTSTTRFAVRTYTHAGVSVDAAVWITVQRIPSMPTIPSEQVVA